MKAGFTRTSFLIVFVDFTSFDAQSQRVDDSVIAETIDGHYQRVTRAIEAAGGRIIKFIGDATLAVFPETAVDSGMRAILDLIAAEDRLMAEKEWECRLHAKAHFGEVIAGDFGAEGSKRYDIMGRAVNATARLKASGAVTLSPDARRKLSPELQRRFP